MATKKSLLDLVGVLSKEEANALRESRERLNVRMRKELQET